MVTLRARLNVDEAKEQRDCQEQSEAVEPISELEDE
jgi:hypothetical protein